MADEVLDDNIKEGFELNMQDYLDEISTLLVRLPKETYNIQRKAMAKGGNFLKKEVKKNYFSYFQNPPKEHDKSKFTSPKAAKSTPAKNEPKNLYQSIKNKAFKKPDLGQLIYSNVHSPYNAILYGFALAKGFSFEVKTKDGGVKEIVVHARDFIQEPSDKAMGNPKLVTEMDKVVQKEMDKMMKDPKKYKFKETN